MCFVSWLDTLKLIKKKIKKCAMTCCLGGVQLWDTLVPLNEIMIYDEIKLINFPYI